MNTVSISALKARLTAFLDVVRNGDEVLVTDRRQPVERTSAVQGAAQVAGQRELLIRSGRLRAPSSGLPPDFWSRLRARDDAGRSLAALLEERDGGQLFSGTLLRWYPCYLSIPSRQLRARLLSATPRLLCGGDRRLSAHQQLLNLSASARLTQCQIAHRSTLLADLAMSRSKIQPGASLREQAMRLLRLHPLHAADARQLAAAIEWAGSGARGVFVC